MREPTRNVPHAGKPGRGRETSPPSLAPSLTSTSTRMINPIPSRPLSASTSASAVAPTSPGTPPPTPMFTATAATADPTLTAPTPKVTSALNKEALETIRKGLIMLEAAMSSPEATSISTAMRGVSNTDAIGGSTSDSPSMNRDTDYIRRASLRTQVDPEALAAAIRRVSKSDAIDDLDSSKESSDQGSTRKDPNVSDAITIDTISIKPEVTTIMAHETQGRNQEGSETNVSRSPLSTLDNVHHNDSKQEPMLVSAIRRTSCTEKQRRKSVSIDQGATLRQDMEEDGTQVPADTSQPVIKSPGIRSPPPTPTVNITARLRAEVPPTLSPPPSPLVQRNAESTRRTNESRKRILSITEYIPTYEMQSGLRRVPSVISSPGQSTTKTQSVHELYVQPAVEKQRQQPNLPPASAISNDPSTTIVRRVSKVNIERERPKSAEAPQTITPPPIVSKSPMSRRSSSVPYGSERERWKLTEPSKYPNIGKFKHEPGERDTALVQRKSFSVNEENLNTSFDRRVTAQQSSHMTTRRRRSGGPVEVREEATSTQETTSTQTYGPKEQNPKLPARSADVPEAPMSRSSHSASQPYQTQKITPSKENLVKRRISTEAKEEVVRTNPKAVSRRTSRSDHDKNPQRRTT